MDNWMLYRSTFTSPPSASCCGSQDAGAAAKAAIVGQAAGTFNTIIDGKFKDDRWSKGTWVLSKFAGKDGETDWNKVSETANQREAMAWDFHGA